MEPELKIIKEVDATEFNIKLKSDGIVYVWFKDNCVLDIDLQLRMLNCYKNITNLKLTPFIFEAEGSINVTKEARDNAIKIEEDSPCSAMAIIVGNIAQAMIANFYMKFNKPKRPYRVFNKKADGIEWLKQYL